MEAIARQRAAAGGQSGGGSGAAPQTQPQPQPQQPSMLRDFLRNPGSVLRERERAAGLRFQDGGVVPGTGEGDKIPAKYEPGEFVVSNDMIDDNPGLREQLSGLRAETLAARGKTVEEADAKALRYHGGLRAQAGFNGSADPDFWRGNPNPLQGNQANQTLLDAARQRIDPVQTAAREAAEASARTVPPSSPPQPTPTNPGMANPQARAAYADMARARAAAPTVAAPAAPTPPAPAAAPAAAGAKPGFLRRGAGATLGALGKATALGGAGYGAYQTATGLQEGDYAKAGLGAADAAASASLITPAAPVGAAWLGARAAHEALQGAVDEFDLGDTIGGTINQLGLRTGLWGNDDSAKLMADAQARAGQSADTLRKTAPARGAGADLRNPYANVTPEQGRAMAEINAGAPGRAPGSQPTPQEAPFDFDTFEPRPGEGAFRNEQTGKVTRLTPTPQGAAWRAAPAQQALVSPAPRLRQEVRAPVLNPNGGVFAAMADFTNQAGRATQAIAANKGLRNDRRDALDAESTFARIDQGERALQISEREADTREKDLGLRREGQTALARSAQQQQAYNRQRDARKDAMDAEQHSQTVGHNADSNARNDTRVFGPDGKVNDGMSAARYDVANQLFPGYSQMDEASRKAVNPDVKEMLDIFDRTYENKQMGFSKLNPLDPRDPKRSAMPNFQGGTLKKQGPEGYLTPGGEMGGYYVTDAEGNDIPLGKLNERQIELIKRQIKTGSWTGKKEGK